MTMAMWIKIIMTIFNCNAMFGTQGVHLIAIQISSSRSPFDDDDNDDEPEACKAAGRAGGPSLQQLWARRQFPDCYHCYHHHRYQLVV